MYADGCRANKDIARRLAKGNGLWVALEELGSKTKTEKQRLQEARKFARLCDPTEFKLLCGMKGRSG
jgi:hypothetical protein